MRRLFVIPLIALVAVAFASAPGTAPATAAPTCQDQFNQLEAHTKALAITSGKPERERTGLLKLAEDAKTLATVGKTPDAIKKLRDFEVKVDQLEAAGRISAQSAGELRMDAEATIACLESSST
jgi:hypothetical protein